MTPTDNLEAELARALSLTLEAGDGRAPAPLAESMRYSLLAPGKRIRPRLSLASARLVGLPAAPATAAALALEMIHCFTLIHDDLPCMDNSDTRRGRPSNHKKFGESTALLAGDALIASAIETFSQAAAHVSAEGFARGLRRLCWAMGPRGVIGGQAAEPLLGPESKLEEVLEMHAAKTGVLFVVSLMIPVDLAGIQGPKGDAVLRFARGLGLAFQIADDLDDAQTQQESGDPKNILFHLSTREARELALEALEGGAEELAQSWGKQPAAELLTISGEVARSLDQG
jgi:geranylgeranyl diphosphate synthase type II